MHKQEQLLAVAGESIAVSSPFFSARVRGKRVPEELLAQLGALLARRNGFYAFERALHVFPAAMKHEDLNSWNEAAAWKSYEGAADGYVFFAEDVFGGQFCLHESGVCIFDLETGKRRVLASSIEHWAGAILRDCDFLTGRPIAEEWTKVNGPLAAGRRLVPIIPFAMGGEYELSNLRDMGAIEGLLFRASVARQIRNIPDGTSVELTTTKMDRGD